MEEKLKLGHCYLVMGRRGGYNPISKIEVLQVTKTCYHILWGGENKTWELMDKFDDLYPEYDIIEDLGLPVGVIFHSGGKGL